ncbi:MAG: ATP-binding protein [Gammaproteobacteria bacterium]|nr:ATP-binding protein [Gammaproteobacteria bacterium]
MKLSSKLLLVMTPLIITPLLILGAVASYKLQQTTTENALHQMTAEVGHISDHLISDINTAKSNMELFSNSILIEKYLKIAAGHDISAALKTKLAAELDAYQSVYPEYDEIKVLRVDGREVAGLEPAGHRDIAKEQSRLDFYKQINNSKAVFSNSYLNADNHHYAIFFAKAVRSAAKDTESGSDILGYISMTMSLAYFKEHIGGKHIANGGDVFFVNQKGDAVFDNKKALSKERISQILHEDINITASSSANYKEYWDDDSVYNVRKINDYLYLIAMLPADVINKAGNELVKMMFFTLLVSMFVAASLMIFVLRRYILNPVSSISKASKEIASGRDIGSLNYRYDDELGELANSFMMMNATVVQSKKELTKAKLRAENLSRVKSSFIENMSHEIRTPLTSIIGFSESLLDGDQEMSARIDSINTIVRSGKHLLDVINGILDFSIIDSEKPDVAHLPVDVRHLISEVKAFAEMQASEKNLAFSVEYLFPIPAVIKSDAVRLRQILINLLANAVKFTEQGRVIMTVSYESKNNKICFEIVDTGIGLTKADMKTVFDAFEQADATTTRKYGGIGLGLYLSKKLAEQLNGTITVESTEGIGSQFAFMMQCEALDGLIYEVPETRSNIKTIAEKPNSKAKFKGKVLVAEDIEDNQKLIKLYLTRIGADCDIVENGKDALAAIEKNHYDAVLMDMQMPVMGGLEAVYELRKYNQDLPVIALTASAMEDDVKGYIKAGCNEFLAKPINRLLFNQTVSRYLLASDEIKPALEAMTSALLEEDEGAIDLVLIFVKKLPELLDEILSLYKDENWDELSARVHNLKGTGGNFGFLKITEVAQKIEFLIMKQGYDEIEDQLDLLTVMQQRIIEGVQ